MKNKKILTLRTIVILLGLITSSISAGALSSVQKQEPSHTTKTMEITLPFSAPIIQEFSDGLSVQMKETNQYLATSGGPVLPIYLRTFEFPLGTRIKNIQGTITQNNEIQLASKITPAVKSIPQAEPLQGLLPQQNPTIYENDVFYPDQWYTSRVSGGLNKNNDHTTFLTIEIHPVRYNPVQDLLQSAHSITLEITYEEPDHPLITAADTYDMIIICYDRYTRLLDPLVTHKNSLGIMTKVVPLKDIYASTYFPVQGRDNQEKIKYFIQDAIETWNVTYVMLVGNYKQVPVRYTALETDAGGQYEELEFVTDLYYSDIYDGAGNFSSWDTNEDGVYGEWSTARVDIVDLNPDVYVGRLACMFSLEVTTVVKKIIEYETTAYGSDWFNQIVVCGGDTFDKSWEGGTDYNEGEEANNQALMFMPQFTPTRLWVSLETLSTDSILEELSKGSGFLYMVGHGNPRKWATHNNGDYSNWTGDFFNKNMWSLSNKGMYPILMIGGCHNSKIDVTPLDIIRGLLTDGFHYFSYSDPYDLGGFWYSNWIPECWAWAFIRVPRGGTIASMGSTGYGGVSIGDSNHNGIPDCVEDMDGWFETQFFRLYNEEHIDMLGHTYAQVINNYIQNFSVYTDRYECKIVETHLFLGDPSMKIGGYEQESPFGEK